MKKLILAVLLVIPLSKTIGQILAPLEFTDHNYWGPKVNNSTVFFNTGNNVYMSPLGGNDTLMGTNDSWEPYYDQLGNFSFTDGSISKIKFTNDSIRNLGGGHQSAITNDSVNGIIFASSTDNFLNADSSYLFAFNQNGSVLWQTTISGYVRKLVPSGSNLFCFYDVNGIARINKYNTTSGNLLGSVAIGPCTDLYYCGATALSTGQLAFCFNYGTSLKLAMINSNLSFSLATVPVSQQVTISDLLEINGKLYGGGFGQPNPLAFRLIEWDLTGSLVNFWINNPSWDEHFECLSSIGIVCTRQNASQTTSDLLIYDYPATATAVPEIVNQNQISVYPNPCTDYVWVNGTKFDTTKFPSGVNLIYTPKGTAKIVKL